MFIKENKEKREGRGIEGLGKEGGPTFRVKTFQKNKKKQKQSFIFRNQFRFFDKNGPATSSISYFSDLQQFLFTNTRVGYIFTPLLSQEETHRTLKHQKRNRD